MALPIELISIKERSIESDSWHMQSMRPNVYGGDSYRSKQNQSGCLQGLKLDKQMSKRQLELIQIGGQESPRGDLSVPRRRSNELPRESDDSFPNALEAPVLRVRS